MSNKSTLSQMTICRLNTVARNDCVITMHRGADFSDWIGMVVGIQTWANKAKSVALMQAFERDYMAGTLGNLLLED